MSEPNLTMSEAPLIKGETIRTISWLLDRYERLQAAIQELAGADLTGVYFVRPTLATGADRPPGQWGELTGDRVDALRKVFQAECDGLVAELKKLGVKP